MAVHVFESTRFESLWQRFARVVRTPQRDVLARETVVVPGSGWEMWFSRRLAREHGCWAQYRFVPLGVWLGEVLSNSLGETLAPPRDPDTLTWIIAKLLPDLIGEPEFAPVRGYLSRGSSDPQRLIDLSRSIGGLFDRYLLYRPELIAAWQAGRDWDGSTREVPPEALWQRRLWQRITGFRSFRSVQAMVQDLDRVLRNDRGNGESLSSDRSAIEAGPMDDAALAKSLPERVSIWVSGLLAPVQLDFLTVVGQHCDIHLYLVTPAREYWGDMYGRRNLLKKLRDTDLSLREFCRTHHVDLLHPLLASMGEVSRQRQMLMADCEGEPWHWPDVDFDDATDDVDPEAALLTRLQDAIHQAIEPRQAATSASASSVRIHSCHSLYRQVEVLHEVLRDELERDPLLQPEDIAVLCPTPDDVAPLVQAVFGRKGPEATGHIPYQIAGRLPRLTRPVIDAFVRLLEVLQGRFEASAVFDLLTADAIARRAGIDQEQAGQLAEWADAAGIRWGLNAAHRAEAGLPASDLNTWEFGLDRLMLGYAMPPGGPQLVGDVVSLDRVAGLEGVLAGRLWAFVSKLRGWKERLARQHSLADWESHVARLIEQFFDASVDEAGVSLLLDAARQLARDSASGGFDHDVSFSVVQRELVRVLDGGGASGFRPGGVLFCSLDAVRSLPFKVVVLLDLSEGTFPRGDRAVGFDLMRHRFQPGDVSPRSEDRHLFLEAVLSARQQLHILYRGQSVHDQREQPPAVPVQELIDALVQPPSGEAGTDSLFEDADADGVSDESNDVPPEDVSPVLVRDDLVVEHPLQPFSPRYFDGTDPRLTSFDRRHLRTATELLSPPLAEGAFAAVTGVAGESVGACGVDNGGDEVSIDDLRRLLHRPWELYLSALGIGTLEPAESAGNREPLVLDALDEWQLGSAWLASLQRGTDSDQARLLARSGMLPAGEHGRAVLNAMQQQARRIWSRHLQMSNGQPPETTTLSIDLRLGRTRLSGRLPDWSPDGFRRLTFRRLKARDTLWLWLDQMLAAASSTRPIPPAVSIGRDSTLVRVPEVTGSEARDWLAILLELHTAARVSPLPFCSTPEIVDPVLQGKIDFDDPDAVSAYVTRARFSFFKDGFGDSARPGPGLEPAALLAFAGVDPFRMSCRDVRSLEHHGDKNLFEYLARAICGGLTA